MIKFFTQQMIALLSLATIVTAHAQCTTISNLPEFQTVCPGTTSVNLSGEVGSGDLFQWETDGTGTFGDDQSLTTTYTFSAADLASEGIIISLVNLSCGLDPAAISYGSFLPVSANAGADFTMCSAGSVVIGNGFGLPSWSTSGTGTFSDLGPENASFAPLYIPSNADITNGSVTITLTITDIFATCPNAATDVVVVTFVNSTATIDAGADQDMEVTGNALNASASDVSNFEWISQDGDGTFDDASILNATYTAGPDDIDAGYAELILTGNGGGCIVSDKLFLANTSAILAASGSEKITIAPNPVVDRAEINLGSTYKGNVVVTLYNSSGQEVYTDVQNVNGSSIVLDQLDTLETGLYQVTIMGESSSYSSRIVKQ